jgi:exopolysaccharide production protein ExoQ
MSYTGLPLAKPETQSARLPRLVFVFLAIAFFYVYHDVLYARNGYNPTEDDLAGAVMDGSPTRRIALLSLAIFAIASLILQRPVGRNQIHGPLGWVLLGFTVLVMVSPIWAEDRSQVVTRVAGFGIFCILALAFESRFSLREIILWTFTASGSYVVIGVAAEIFFGTFRPAANGYRFAGTLHPNSQGVNCALLLLSGIAAADVEKRGRTLFRICAFVGFVFLVLTASRTAFGAALLALAAYLGAACSRRTKMAIAYVLSIVLCVLLLGLGNAFLPDLKNAVNLGRVDESEGSLNGRAGVWDEIGSYVERRPVLGYGFGGFWTPARISEISKEEKWGIPNSHSAYLDYLLALGAVGLMAYVFLLFAGIWRAFRFHRVTRNSAYAFCGAILVFCAMDGFLESSTTELSLAMFLTLLVLTFLAVGNDSHALRFFPFSIAAGNQSSRNY